MNGPLLLGLALSWLVIDILVAIAMSKIKDEGKFLKVRTAFIAVNIVVILGGLLYLYMQFGSDNI